MWTIPVWIEIASRGRYDKLEEKWNEYQGFYLKMGADGDVHLHSQRSERLAPLMGLVDGFARFTMQPTR